jgi:hypothetical protein
MYEAASIIVRDHFGDHPFGGECVWIIQIGVANLAHCQRDRHVEIGSINLGKIAGLHQPRGGVDEIIALDLERGNTSRQLLNIFVGRFE